MKIEEILANWRDKLEDLNRRMFLKLMTGIPITNKAREKWMNQKEKQEEQ